MPKSLQYVNVTPTATSYQSRECMGWEQLHHLGNHLQTLTQVLLPLCLFLWLPNEVKHLDFEVKARNTCLMKLK